MKQSVIISIIYSLIGISVGLYISHLSSAEGYDYFPIFSGLSSFIVTFLIWKYIVLRREQTTLFAGGFAGFIIVLLSHHLTLYFLTVVIYIQIKFFNFPMSVGGEPIDPIQGIYLIYPMTIFSYILPGYITIPLGTIIGCIYIKLQNRSKGI